MQRTILNFGFHSQYTFKRIRLNKLPIIEYIPKDLYNIYTASYIFIAGICFFYYGARRARRVFLGLAAGSERLSH